MKKTSTQSSALVNNLVSFRLEVLSDQEAQNLSGGSWVDVLFPKTVDTVKKIAQREIVKESL